MPTLPLSCHVVVGVAGVSVSRSAIHFSLFNSITMDITVAGLLKKKKKSAIFVVQGLLCTAQPFPACHMSYGG